MPHVLAGPVYARIGAALNLRVVLLKSFEQGGFMIEIADRSGRLPWWDKFKGRYPPMWSPLVMPTESLIHDLEKSGMAIATPISGALHVDAPKIVKSFIAPVSAYYRIIQEQTKANPKPTCSATLRRKNAFG